MYKVNVQDIPYYLLLLFAFSLPLSTAAPFMISLFLIIMSLSELFTYLVFFDLIDPFMHATKTTPAPFLSHIIYSSIIAFAIYLLSHFILFSNDLSKPKKIIYLLFALTMTFNLLIFGGRAGQVMFFGVMLLLLFQYFHQKKVMALLLSIFILPILFASFYYTIPDFKNRVDRGYTDLLKFKESRNTPLGLRINFTLNSIEIIQQNAILGVGTGGFKENYKQVNLKNTPEVSSTINPHNMYIFVLVELGIIGIILFSSILYNDNTFTEKQGV